MRNFIKTRKGGMFTPNYYRCGTKISKGKIVKLSLTECIKQFTDKKFTFIKTPDDGDCFYHVLSIFGKRSGNPKTDKTPKELREKIVGDMIKMISNKSNELSQFIVPNDEDANPFTTDEQKIDQLKEYLKPKVWFGRTGDLIPQKAADILGINITIYDVREDNTYYINRLRYFGGTKDDIPVSMLRTNGNHYRLLWPKEIPIRGRKTAKNKSPNSLLNSLNSLNSNNELRKVLKASKELYNKEYKMHNEEKNEEKNEKKNILPNITLKTTYTGRITRAKAKELQDKNLSKVFQNTSFF